MKRVPTNGLLSRSRFLCLKDQPTTSGRLEPIAVRFSSNDRAQPRVFSLRKDFPYPPHINLQPKDSARDLCLYDRPWHEVSFSWTGAQFAARIIWWLEETAHGSLHQNDQPLEPLLFGSFSDLIIPPRFLDGSSQAIPRWATIRKIPRHDNTYALLLDQSTFPPGVMTPTGAS